MDIIKHQWDIGCLLCFFSLLLIGIFLLINYMIAICFFGITIVGGLLLRFSEENLEARGKSIENYAKNLELNRKRKEEKRKKIEQEKVSN